MKKRQQNELIRYDKLYIGGEWVKPSTDAVIEVRSPHDQSLVGITAEGGPADVDLAVSAAEKAFNQGPWPQLSPEERQQTIERFNELHSKHATELASLTTQENGSAIWFTSVLQTMVKEQTAAYLRAAKSYPWEIGRPTTAGQKAVIRREPVGVVAVVIPWNAPQQSALVKIIPALLAGCTVVFKPSPETALDGIALGEIFAAAGLPAGVINIVPAGREVSEYLVSHPRINKIAFTGSTRAGKRIASIAGEQLKRCSLELGGKSAAIILEDADLATTVGSLNMRLSGTTGNPALRKPGYWHPKTVMRKW